MPDDHPHPDTETLLRRVIEMVNNARTMPMSNTIRLTKDEIQELLEEALKGADETGGMFVSDRVCYFLYTHVTLQ